MDSEDLMSVIYDITPEQGVFAPILRAGSKRTMTRRIGQSMRARRRRVCKPLRLSAWRKPVLHEWIVDARA